MTPRGGSPIWHPFTQHALQPQMLEIAGAQGAWLDTRDSRRILDGISSWWVVTHGHCHPRIVAAIEHKRAGWTRSSSPVSRTSQPRCWRAA